MIRGRLALGRIGSILFVAGGWLLAGARTVLDIIGYSTAPGDAQVAAGIFRNLVGWLLSIPWWAVWGFALVSTLWLIWISWPRSRLVESSPAPNKLRPSAAPAIGHTGDEAHVVSELKEEGRARTLPHDIPNKVKAIDEALEIFGHGNELHNKTKEGQSLWAKCEEEIANKRVEQYLTELNEYRDRFFETIRNMIDIGHKNEKYDDIKELLLNNDLVKNGYASNLIHSLGIFIDNLKWMGPNPDKGHIHLFNPQSKGLQNSIKDLEIWRRETNDSLVGCRKDLTG